MCFNIVLIYFSDDALIELDCGRAVRIENGTLQLWDRQLQLSRHQGTEINFNEVRELMVQFGRILNTMEEMGKLWIFLYLENI